MNYSPKKDNLKTNIIFFFGILLLLTLFFLSRLGVILEVVCHFVFMAEAVFYTFLLNKFVLPIYTYSLNNKEFTIVKTMGNKKILECSIELSKICDILPYKEYKNKEDTEIKSVYNYCANFSASSRYCLIFEYSNCKEAVLFEPNSKMVTIIKDYVKSGLKENL